MKKISIIVIIICICVILLIKLVPAEQTCSFSGFYFDTAVNCKVISEKDIRADITDILKNAENEFSAYDENSSVYRINDGEAYSSDNFCEIDSILRGYAKTEEIIDRGVTPFCGGLTMLWDVTGDNAHVPDEKEIEDAMKYVYDASAYRDNIPVGARLDLGSAVKGYVCDNVFSAVTADKDIKEIILSTGSSSVLWSEDNREFTTSVIDPTSDDNIIICTNNAFISTSGGYERYFEADGRKYSHIIDIDTGYPVETDIASATVVLSCENENGMMSDILSTLIYIGGSEMAEEYYNKCKAHFTDCGILIILQSGDVVIYGNIQMAE